MITLPTWKTPWIGVLSATLTILITFACPVAAAQQAPHGQVIRSPDGIVLRLAPGVNARRMPASDLQIHRGAKTRSLPVQLKSGRIDVFVPKVGQRIPKLTVEGDDISGAAKARTAVAVVVTCSRDRMAIVESGWTTVMTRGGKVIVANHRGEAKLGTLRSIQPVRPGYVSVLDIDPRGNEVVSLPTSTSFFPSGRVLITRPGRQVSISKLSWKPVPGAASYTVKITSPTSPRFQYVIHTKSSNLGHWNRALNPGAYQIAVRTVDKFGFSSETEAITQVRVASLGLPLGGYIDEKGQVWMRMGQHILLTHTEGLRMSFSGGRQWSKSSRDIGLYHNATRTVLLKHPGDKQPARLLLRAINVTADVAMEPTEPVWPGPPVTVDVYVHTTDGQPLPPRLRPFAQVTLGNRPVTVRWRRRGPRLHAIVPTRALPGPRVLRVEVSDQFGLPLGRNFVEISVKSKKASQ